MYFSKSGESAASTGALSTAIIAETNCGCCRASTMAVFAPLLVFPVRSVFSLFISSMFVSDRIYLKPMCGIRTSNGLKVLACVTGVDGRSSPRPLPLLYRYGLHDAGNRRDFEDPIESNNRLSVICPDFAIATARGRVRKGEQL